MGETPDESACSVPSAVRILRGEQELRDALRRADAAAKLIAERTTARSNRYSRLIAQLDDSDADVRLHVVEGADRHRQTS